MLNQIFVILRKLKSQGKLMTLQVTVRMEIEGNGAADKANIWLQPAQLLKTILFSTFISRILWKFHQLYQQ